MSSTIPAELLRMTILVVDDLADNRNAITTLLTANGFENLLEAASSALRRTWCCSISACREWMAVEFLTI